MRTVRRLALRVLAVPRIAEAQIWDDVPHSDVPEDVNNPRCLRLEVSRSVRSRAR
jgi:hypothetical protein